MAGRRPGTPKTGGRKAGTPNKITANLRDAILNAAEKAGGPGGVTGYLTTQASANPAAFMTLLGKVLPANIDLSNSDGTLSRPTEIILKGPDDAGDVGDTA